MGLSPADLGAYLAWLLLGAALVAMVSHWIRIPYAVTLVVAGLIAGSFQLIPGPILDPDVILFLFLPPLLFDAAFRLDERELRVVVPPVLAMAVPGVVITAAVVGATLVLVLQMSLFSALLFGSVVAATDPVAVTAVFHRLGVHSRLATIAEAESLVNDGTAITLYASLIALASGGTATPWGAAGIFLTQVVGGVVIGVTAGIAFSRLAAATDDHLVEMMLSTGLAYGSFLLAQSLHTSGALACVTAGLIHGSYGRRVGLSAKAREVLDDLWEYLGFFANALVFLLVGFSTKLPQLATAAWPIAVAVAAVLASRVVVVELSALTMPRERSFLSAAGRLVLAWGGLRGALTLALALAIPDSVPGRELMVAMAYGVVLFTLLVQASTLAPVVRGFGLTTTDYRTGGPQAPRIRRRNGDAPAASPAPGGRMGDTHRTPG